MSKFFKDFKELVTGEALLKATQHSEKVLKSEIAKENKILAGSGELLAAKKALPSQRKLRNTVIKTGITQGAVAGTVVGTSIAVPVGVVRALTKE